MKKILALILVCFLAFSFAACSSNGDESSTPFTPSGTSSEATGSSSSEAASSEDVTSEAAVSDETSAEASGETSGEVSDETSKTEEVVFTNKYISWKDSIAKSIVSLRATDSTSIKVSRINEAVVAGDVGVFTSAYGATIKSAGQDYSEFAIAVFEYTKSVFDYTEKSFSDVGKGSAETKIPSDGYVLVIHKDNANYIKNLKAAPDGSQFYPHGIIINDGLHTSIKKTSKAPTIDGKVSKAEYGTAVWEIKPDNSLVSYAQFEVNNYYSTATVYLTYDSEYLYIGVVVDSPYHDNTVTSANASSMYNFECIQVNVCSVATTSDYISEHWDNIIDKTAAAANVVRQYGFCVNDSGETISCVWMGNPNTFSGNAVCARDDANAQTIYEVALPWSECGSADYPVDVKSGSKFGFSLSVNSGNNTFKNIFLRDGGGIIGLNDWSKVPTITFK